jgi:hypothetical protein
MLVGCIASLIFLQLYYTEDLVKNIGYGRNEKSTQYGRYGSIE